MLGGIPRIHFGARGQKARPRGQAGHLGKPDHGSADFPYNEQLGNLFKLCGLLVSVTDIQVCQCWAKAALDDT